MSFSPDSIFKTRLAVLYLFQVLWFTFFGYGGRLNIPTIDVISTKISFIGNLVGNYNDLVELMTLNPLIGEE